MEKVSEKFGGMVKTLWDKFQAKPGTGKPVKSRTMITAPPTTALAPLPAPLVAVPRGAPAPPAQEPLFMLPLQPKTSSPYALILQNAEKDKRLEGENIKLLRKLSQIDDFVSETYNEKIKPKAKFFCPVTMYKTLKFSFSMRSDPE